MPKQKKLRLSDLKVSSFITSQESKNVKGMTMLATNCADTDCASVYVYHLCEAPIEPTQVGCPVKVTRNVTCPASCYGSCNNCGGSGAEYSGTNDPTVLCAACTC